MIENLTVTLVQFDPVWEDKKANLEKISSCMDNLGKCDLVVLPEMFSTGFSVNPVGLAEEMDGPTVSWMAEKASGLQAVVAGSLIIQDKGNFYNRLIWMTPGKIAGWYDKKHLFSMGEEHHGFYPGNKRVTIEWKGWKIRLIICYDLRFPVWCRNDDGYDILLCVASWPSSRHEVWKRLLITRAIENQCFSMGVNRIGSDGSGIKHRGDSGMVNPYGKPVWLKGKMAAGTFSLSYEELRSYRENFPVLKDMDPFILK